MDETTNTGDAHVERKARPTFWSVIECGVLVLLELWFPWYQIRTSPSSVRKTIAGSTVAFGFLLAAAALLTGNLAAAAVAAGGFGFFGFVLFVADRRWVLEANESRRRRWRSR